MRTRQIEPPPELHARTATACFIPLRSAIVIAIAIAVFGTPSIARAQGHRANDDPAATQDVASTEPAPRGTAWGPIVAGCLGVLFGAAIAAWHIRGKRRQA